MKNQRLIFTIIILIISISIVKAQEKISLSQAITIALNQNSSIVQSTNSLRTSQAAVKNAYGDLLPSLSLSGSWGWQHISDNTGTTQIDYLGNEQTVSASETESRSYSLSLGGSVTLFDGLSSLKSISQKKNDLASARLELEKLKQDAILQTVNLFITVINDEKILAFQEENYKYNTEMLEKIKQMYELKMIAIVDLYSQEYETANSKLAYIQAKNDYEKAILSLLTYLSKDVTLDYTFELDSTNTLNIAENLDNFGPLYETALSRRSDFQSEKLQVENSEYQLTIANSDLYPSLSGSYGLSTSAVTPGDLFSRKVYSVGLSLNLPIFSHWSTEYSIESAKVQIDNENETLKALERQIKSEVKSSALDLQSSKLQEEVTKTALKSAKETWDIKKEKYTLGATTFIDQQQSYNDYIDAMNNSIAAESNYIYKKYELLNVLGLLDVE